MSTMSFKQRRRVSFTCQGSSTAYILVILFVVCLVSYLLVGGLFPRIVKKPIDPVRVDVAAASVSRKTNTLQLVNLQAISPGREACLSASGVLLLVDESSSLNYLNETDDLKTALRSFLPYLSPSTLVGLYVFSSPLPQGDPRELVPLGEYQANREALLSQIDAIAPFGDTYMKDGFVLIRDTLQRAQALYPGHTFSVVFFSDGSPDPADQNPETIAEEIKNPPYNATIFSIALDQADNQVMERVASDPKSIYFIESPTAADLKSAYETIGQRICS